LRLRLEPARRLAQPRIALLASFLESVASEAGDSLY
jgi:hypothetical protein